MSKIKQGDRVRIKKPADGSYWNGRGDMDYLDGKVVMVGPRLTTVNGACFQYDSWYIYFDWCEVVEEMTLAQWEKMSPQERLEWNRPAFEALASEEAEWLGADGTWRPSDSVDLLAPHRVVEKPTGPPKEIWFVTDDKGYIATGYFSNSEEAEVAAKGYHENFGARVVKYVIAE